MKDSYLNIFDDGIHYNFYPDWKREWDYALIQSGRNVGKSYSIKSILCKRSFMQANSKFIYLRRSIGQIKPKDVQFYFRDLPVEKIDNTCIIKPQFRANKITFKMYDIDDPLKQVDERDIGYMFALSEADNIRSYNFDDVDVILYEEFTKRGVYLPNEIALFDHLISTVSRSRKIRVILVGNTITRACPYFSKWGIEDIINQKIGTTVMYKFNDYGNDLTLMSRYIETPKDVENPMAFGERSESIVKGSWEVDKFPKPPFPVNGKIPIYTCVFEAMNLKFIARCYNSNNGRFWYIEPKTTIIKEHTRVFCDYDNPDRFYVKGFYPITIKERTLFKEFPRAKKYYASDLCGTDFDICLSTLKRKIY